MKAKSYPSRRNFLKKSAVATFGFTVLPSYLALGKKDSEGNVPPSPRINLAAIGIGGRGSVIVPALRISKGSGLVFRCT